MSSVEFSRPVRIDELGLRDRVIGIEATAPEREALARRLELEAIDRLVATVRLRRVQGGRFVRLAAELEAAVVQTCVVSLDPVPVELRSAFEILYDPGAGSDGREVVVDTGEVDVEPLEGDVIDIGEAVAEELSLALEPYPRAPGVEIEAPTEVDGGHRPFERLARLKRSH